MIGNPLRTEFWKSVLSSGDLKSLRDFDLLYSIAEAYAQIGNVREWEDRLAAIPTGAGRTITMTLAHSRKGNDVGKYIYGWVVPTFTVTEDAIKRAIEALDKAQSTDAQRAKQ
jgi:hypothetical protein